MAQPKLGVQPIRNELVSRYISAATKNPLPLGIGSVKVNNQDGAGAPSFFVKVPPVKGNQRATHKEEQEAGICRDRGAGL